MLRRGWNFRYLATKRPAYFGLQVNECPTSRGDFAVVHGCAQMHLRSFCSSERGSLPQVPPPLESRLGKAVTSKLVPRETVFIDSADAAEDVLPELMSSRLFGMDCEGVALGRWGRLCLLQIATPERVYLFDALREGVIDVLRPVLEDPSTVKVMHDCREDTSALLSQFDVDVATIFDTQVAHTMMLERESTRPFQISLNQLLKDALHLENEAEDVLSERMRDDPNVWFYRPLDSDLTAYAAQDVMYLPLLHHVLCDQLQDLTGGKIIERSKSYTSYSRMNLHLMSPKAAERRGLRLQAMVATRTENALYMKLNLGAQRQGAVSRDEALSRFKDLKFGDVVDCWVSAWNTTGNVLFLERLESGNTFPEPPSDFTTGKFGKRKGRRPRGPRDG